MHRHCLINLHYKLAAKYPTPVNLRYLSSFLSVFPYSVAKIEYIKISKRTMLSRATGYMRNLMYRGNIYGVQQNRDFATMVNVVRTAPPKKMPHPVELKRDPETNLEILELNDCSGKNHFYVINLDEKHPNYYKVYGVWTTSNSKFRGKWPVYAGDYTLEGESIPQYIHLYDEPKLMPIIGCKIDLLTTINMSFPEYQSILKTIKTP